MAGPDGLQYVWIPSLFHCIIKEMHTDQPNKPSDLPEPTNAIFYLSGDRKVVCEVPKPTTAELNTLIKGKETPFTDADDAYFYVAFASKHLTVAAARTDAGCA